VVAAGAALTGAEVAAGEAGHTGRIVVRTGWSATEYAGSPERTAGTFVDGRVYTGDVGFVRDGQLFPVGRTDDLIQVAGRNLLATEVEGALAAVNGVRAGSCVLVPADDGLVLIAEPSRFCKSPAELAQTLLMQTAELAGIRPHACLIVERGALPKTPSGKVQRFRARRLADCDDGLVIARAGPARAAV
jgi:acyl-coenzyme A synthetase/AMP-(fatty) acid ligase